MRATLYDNRKKKPNIYVFLKHELLPINENVISSIDIFYIPTRKTTSQRNTSSSCIFLS